MLRLTALILAIIGIFAFPWPLAAAFVVIASLFVPPVALIAGVLFDTLYYVPGAYMVPLYTILGLIAFIICEAVHGFAKARIIT